MSEKKDVSPYSKNRKKMPKNWVVIYIHPFPKNSQGLVPYRRPFPVANRHPLSVPKNAASYFSKTALSYHFCVSQNEACRRK